MQKKQLDKELLTIFEELNISHNDNIYITGNISKLAKTRLNKLEILSSLKDSLLKKVGKGGTIFFPTASMNLCNTNITFDIQTTPAHEMGPLAEYLRQDDKSLRSFHPFWSIGGLGKNSSVLNDVSRHSYGLFSPWSYFLDLDVKQINLGIHPSKAVTLIHHVETTVGVPYRYTKEFIHPVLRNNKVLMEPFYMSVLYRDADIQKRIDLNEHYFNSMAKESLIFKTEHTTGLNIWSFKMNSFIKVVEPFFKKDIYNYLERNPNIRPFQK